MKLARLILLPLLLLCFAFQSGDRPAEWRWTCYDSGTVYSAFHRAAYLPEWRTTLIWGGLYSGGTPHFWSGSRWGWRHGPHYGPRARWDHTLAYVASKQAAILYGGVDREVGVQDTAWAVNGYKWGYLGPQAPGPRYRHAMAYDSARDVLVLHGGADSTDALLGDTWEWDMQTWSWAQTESPGPSAREWASMIYDARHGRVLLFGGRDANGPLGDLWAYDGSDGWSELDAPGPSPRYGAGLVWDSTRQIGILFGGWGPGVEQYGDTWIFGTRWRQLEMWGPIPRSHMALAYDSRRGCIVMHGGFFNYAGDGSDLWEGTLGCR